MDVMISIQPDWVNKILKGEKSIEVRKSAPTLQPPFRCFIYCTKKRPPADTFNGKVVGEFVCDEIIVVDCDSVNPFDARTLQYIEKETCLDRSAFWKYLKGKRGYGWHISDLVIYDRPKELEEFSRVDYKHLPIQRWAVDRAPQSWCYVEMEEKRERE